MEGFQSAEKIFRFISQRINLLQSELAAKRLGLQASSTPSTSKFSFRRTAKTEPQRLNAAMATSKQSNLPHSSQPPQSSNASASNVQIALQTNRFISFKDLSKALDSAADSTGLSLSLSHLTECIVDFRSMPKELVTIKATNVKKSLLLLPAVSSSIMIDGLEDSIVITQSCKQFRLHASHTAHLVVNSSSPVTIESCTGIKISTSRDELLVQDFDAPGAGPSSQPTKSWQPLSPPERAALDNAVTSLSESEAQEASQLSKLPALLPSQQARAAPTPSQTSPYRAEDAGILLVFSDPGETSTLAEFHDWYDNEHVPMRSEVYDEFRSAARYSVPVSSHSSAEASQAFAHSGWAAAYIISSNALYNDPTYVALRSKRSPREADLVARLGVLDRRIYKTLVDSVGSREASIAPMKKAEVESTASRVELIGFNTSAKSNNDEAQIAKWFAEEALPTLRSKCTHLERVKLIKLIDALVNGKQVAAGNVDAKHVADWALLAGECHLARRPPVCPTLVSVC